MFFQNNCLQPSFNQTQLAMEVDQMQMPEIPLLCNLQAATVKIAVSMSIRMQIMA